MENNILENLGEISKENDIESSQNQSQEKKSKIILITF